jgi:predicted O-linked N-acetylglucosamine transferase (SPINDLY family)
MLKELGQFKSAIAAYNAAHQADPKSVAILNNSAVLMRTLGRLEEAERICRDALKIDPKHPSLHNTLGNVLKDSGQLDEAIKCFDKSLAIDPTNVVTHSNLVYSLSFRAIEPWPILEECRRFNARHITPLRKEIRQHEIDRTPNRRLRIGYVSPDFRDHCQALFTVPLLANHDREAFEIFCYSSVERPDAVTQRISGFADVWRDVRTLDDAALAAQIRKDRIDILVDLTMHMSHNRPLMFARKPAPIQVAWLAYPGTTGISTMDFRLTDPRLDPPGFESHYTERTIRLPDSFWCYDPLTDQPECNPLPAASRGYLTLGCLNNPCKITNPTIRLWAGVMRSLPTARLMLMAPPGAQRKQLLARLAVYQIASERVSFFAFRPRDQYLTSYHHIDLGLDTFPYNGHTTSLDSLWMGVPVVTRVGPTCVGRAGLSQLFNLDLVELAAETNEEFTQIAIDFASDLPRLAKLRAELRGRLQRSPLMDGKRFARNIEGAYRKMFDDYCAPPASL